MKVSISLSKLFSSILQQNTRQLKTQVCLTQPNDFHVSGFKQFHKESVYYKIHSSNLSNRYVQSLL